MSRSRLHSACRLDLVVGTRPNIVKAAPLARVLSQQEWCNLRIVFLEQHQSAELGDQILTDLRVSPERLLRLPLSANEFGQRLGEMIGLYSTELDKRQVDMVAVFGDVDATLAAALAAKRMRVPLAHIEAGLRSHDRTMPEELNRLMVDAIADLLLATSQDAVDTLTQVEGKAPGTVHLVGNLMIDSLVGTVDPAAGQRMCEALDLECNNFLIATFHRPSNVDDTVRLPAVLDLLAAASQRMPVVLPLHPRTAAALEEQRLRAKADAIEGLRILPSLRYRDFIQLLSQCRAAITDSGGLQEETSYLGIPCLTVRENTERPITVSLGTNRLTSLEGAIAQLDKILNAPWPVRPIIPLWDGSTASRIEAVLSQWWSLRSS